MFTDFFVMTYLINEYKLNEVLCLASCHYIFLIQSYDIDIGITSDVGRLFLCLQMVVYCTGFMLGVVVRHIV